MHTQDLKDNIMHIITSAQKDTDQTIRFGINSLAQRFQTKASIKQIADAIESLISSEHIKRLGAHTVGIGNGKGIKPYDLSHFDPLKHYGGTPQREGLRKGETKTKKQPAKAPSWEADLPPAKPEPVTTIAGDIKDLAFTSTASNDYNTQLDQAIKTLQSKLHQGPTINDLHTKTKTLERLANLLDPTIGAVLISIRNDLKKVAA